jgi:hypothetical protein
MDSYRPHPTHGTGYRGVVYTGDVDATKEQIISKVKVSILHCSARVETVG